VSTSSPTPERLLAALAPRLDGRDVLDLRVGLLYAAARLSDGRTGLAHLLADRGGPCRSLPRAGSLAGTPARDLAEWLLSRDTARASVGLAVLNAAAPAPRESIEADVRALVRISGGDRVAMVGYFAPLLPWLREAGAGVDILELRPLPGTRDAHEAAAVLPACDIALVTATALINHTLDDLLALAVRAREVILLGPSTPMVPEIFAGTPVTMLAGVEVTDSERMLKLVSEGASTREFGDAVRKVCLRLAASPGQADPAA